MYRVWLLRSPSAAHSALWYLCEWLYGHGGGKGPAGRQSTRRSVKSDCCCSFPSTTATVMSYPQNFSADVRDPVLLKRAALGVFHKVGHWSRATKLHHQLNKATDATGELADRMSLTTGKHQARYGGDEPRAGHHVPGDSSWRRHRSKWLCCDGDCTSSACWFRLWSPLPPPPSHPSLWWRPAGRSSRDGPGSTNRVIVTAVYKNHCRPAVPCLNCVFCKSNEADIFQTGYMPTSKWNLRNRDPSTVKLIHVYFITSWSVLKQLITVLTLYTCPYVPLPTTSTSSNIPAGSYETQRLTH